jgi:hypothetical protein
MILCLTIALKIILRPKRGEYHENWENSEEFRDQFPSLRQVNCV